MGGLQTLLELFEFCLQVFRVLLLSLQLLLQTQVLSIFEFFQLLLSLCQLYLLLLPIFNHSLFFLLINSNTFFELFYLLIQLSIRSSFGFELSVDSPFSFKLSAKLLILCMNILLQFLDLLQKEEMLSDHLLELLLLLILNLLFLFF